MFFSLEKTLTFRNDIKLIKSVFNKNQNYYYYNIFLEKDSNQSPKTMTIYKFLYELKILLSEKIDVSERIDVNKTSKSNEYDICHNWYF